MKKVQILSLIMAILLVGGCAGKKESIKIGFIGPLTGDAANYGKLMTQAIRIAVDEFNANGGIEGHPIEFIAEDDEGKVEKANIAIEKLIKVNRIFGFVGAVFSSSSLAIAPRAQQNKVIMITPSSTHKDLTSKGDFIFRNVLSDQLQAQVFAMYVYKVMGIRRVAVLYLKNDYSQGLAEDFKARFEKLGGVITAMESGQQGDKDFKAQLTKIKGTGPEALYMPDYVAEMAQILEQAHQLGLKAKILSADGYSNPQIFDLAGDLADGVIFSNSAEEEAIKNPVRQEFEKKYQEKWGVKPDSFSLNSYDAAVILIKAIEKVYNESSPADREKLNLNRDRIREVVAQTSGYNGVSGVITFLPNGDAMKNVGIFMAKDKKYTQLGVYQIENDKLVEVK